jgi:hypothetical protein
MYTSFVETLLTSLVQRINFAPLTRIHFSKKARAIAVVLMLLLASFFAGGIAVFTSHAYLPLAVLGVLFGVLLSYPATTLLGPKLQAALGGLLGGLTLGNISSKVASLRSTILVFSKSITDLVKGLGLALSNPEKAAYVEGAIVYCIWMTIITMFLIVATSAYLEESTSSASGTATPTPPTVPGTQTRAAAH